MKIDLFTFVLLALACWRLASLFANENGPFYIFRKLRAYALKLCKRYKFCKELHLWELIECEMCNSIWFGMFFTILYILIGNYVLIIALPLALSTVAIIIKLTIIHPVRSEK